MLAAHILAIVFISQLIAWIGQSKLTALAFPVWISITQPKLQKKHRNLRKEILNTKREFSSTSSQDEFAKWARLRRKLDKEVADLERLNSESSTARVKFSATLKSIIWIMTTGTQFILISWHRSTPVFYVPEAWLPSIVRRILAFPFAPSGAVSPAVWAFACRRALNVIVNATPSRGHSL